MNNKKLIKKQYLKSVNQQNARKWSRKRQAGGELSKLDQYQQILTNQDAQLRKYSELEELKQKRMEQLHKQQIQKAQQLGSKIGGIVGQIGGGVSNELLGDTKFGKWVDKVDTKFNDWLSNGKENDKEDDKEEDIKEQIDELNQDILAQSKKQLESWEMDNAKLMESLKLPVINSDEILGNDFLEMLNKQRIK